ncbi:MAG: hypothetical protein H6834_08160 [Planctomycetes bacterium]|nr:hypothetical protein [Planctomycetota bacterium]
MRSKTPRLHARLTNLLPLSIPVLLSFGCSIFEDESLTRTGADTPSSATCGHCHMRQYEEWSASTHALAYANEAFRQASDDYRLGDCLGCHAPDSVFDGRNLHARDVHRDEGVNCVSCHFQDGAMQGPLEHTSFVEPHPLGSPNPTYRSSQFCGTCHVRALQQVEASPEEGRKTCQECHMPEITRTVTQADDLIGKIFVAMEEDKAQRRHTFHLDAVQDLDEAFDLVIEPALQGLRVVLENHLPHSVPTGSFGTRRVQLHVSIVDAQGERHTFEHTFRPQDDRVLAAGGYHILDCPVGQPVTAEARLMRLGAPDRPPISLATTQWESSR